MHNRYTAILSFLKRERTENVILQTFLTVCMTVSVRFKTSFKTALNRSKTLRNGHERWTSINVRDGTQ
jgi:hypothetical protein